MQVSFINFTRYTASIDIVEGAAEKHIIIDQIKEWTKHHNNTLFRGYNWDLMSEPTCVATVDIVDELDKTMFVLKFGHMIINTEEVYAA